MFNKNGQPHKLGILNEIDTINILKRIYKNENIYHWGGTKNKADVYISNNDEFRYISVKRKNNISSGSFDYINTSKIYVLSDFKEPLSIYNKGRSIGYYDEETKNVLEKSIIEELNNIDTENLSRFLYKFLIKAHEEENIDILINDIYNKVIYIFKIHQHPLYKYLKNNYTPIIKKCNKQSKVILFKNENGDIEPDIGLRLRLHLNNGYRAWFGISNKSCNLVLKLQQDKVDKLINNIGEKEIYEYRDYI